MSKKEKKVKEVVLTSSTVNNFYKFECPICQDSWSSLVNKDNSCPQCGNKEVKIVRRANNG